MERKYQYRERLLKVHKENVRNYEIKASENDFLFADETVITIPEIYEPVMLTAANDLRDYLFTSMNLSARVGMDGSVVIRIDLEKQDDKDWFEIDVNDKIYINATNCRTAAQALYYLEDLMSERKAPLVKKGKVKKVLSFAPRIIRTSYMKLNTDAVVTPLPDEYLAHIVHHGFTGLMITYKGLEDKLTVVIDELLEKCERYGVDLYFNADIPCKYHPDEPEAKDYYMNTYGAVFKRFPKIKGFTMVGESVGFPSKDPNTCGEHRPKPADRIPPMKNGTGFYPCYDYYKLVEIIRDSVRTYKPDAEIIFWTYNFWGASLEKRYELIDNMPTDVGYMVTFELSEQYEMDGITKLVCDYSISRPGPCKTFIEEAAYAKKHGMKIYSMTSTAGMTWDFGTTPYMPVPQKWIKRYKAMLDAQDKYGLEGILECWTPGFYPSIVSELAKKCFMDRNSDFYENLRIILKNHFGNDADTVYKALELWSEASDYIHASYDEQYGPLRVGTAYPLGFLSNPNTPYGSPWLKYIHGHGASALQSLYAVRDEVETMHWQKMADLMDEGVNLLKTIENPSEELELLTNLGKYIYHCVVTVINIHRWHKHRDWIVVEKNKDTVREIIAEMKKIAADEVKNAVDSIECLRKDSRLGFEPQDDYVGGEEAILWKVKHTEFMLEKELKKFEAELLLL